MTNPHALTLADVVVAPPLLIQYLQGTNDVLVVSLAGVGTERSVQPEPEFFKLSHMESNHVLFVSDISRSWMNGPKIAETIVAVIERVKTANGIKRVVALGNSMGGTMALLLARITKIDAAFSVVPQYSAKPELVPEEMRWQYFRKKITAWPFPAVDTLPDEGTEVTILHGGDASERVHLDRFPRADHVRHFVFPTQGHNLARVLHKKGQLARILRHAILGQPYKMRRAIEAAGGIFRDAFDAQRNDLSIQEK